MLGRCLRSALAFLTALFILWQLAFMLGMNACEMTRHYLDYLTEETDNVPGLLDPDTTEGRRFRQVELLFTRWAEFSNQPQSWSLFAPNIWSHIPFVAVELRWDDGPAGAPPAANAPHPPVLLLSDNEPADVLHYIRTGDFRLRRFESSIDVGMPIDTDKSAEDMQDRWRQKTFERVKNQAVAIRAYLEWRWSRYSGEHPGIEQPKQVVLLQRIYRIPAPADAHPWKLDPPEFHTLARWRPGFAYADNALPVEVYDRLAERFDVLP
jgi:hypothetical protein